jgi:hypothetical protein
MGLAWMVVAAVVLTLVLVYLRHVAHRHVAALFCSTARRLMAAGSPIEPALGEAIRRFVRRAPFNRLQEDDLAFFLCVVQDVGAPVEVGAEILQRCEIRQDATELRDQQKTARLAYSIDLRLSLHQWMQNARTLHKKASHRYPNITIALLASLSAREGWTFVEEQNEVLLFTYRQKPVRVPKQASGKDAARLVLREEMAQRPLAARQDRGFEIRKSVRQNLADNFDSFFEEVFQNMAASGTGPGIGRGPARFLKRNASKPSV